MKYGYKCTSTMCGLSFYIIEDTKDYCLKAFNNFMNYLNNEPNTWEVYCYTYPVYCSDDTDYDFTVTETGNGKYMMVTNWGRNFDDDYEQFEFELIGTFEDRF